VVRALSVGLALLALAAAPAVAGEAARETNEDETRGLWDPLEAAAFLLAVPDARVEVPPAAPWDGSLPGGIVRVLFGGYRLVLSSQDLPVCGFEPSCSRFSQRAIARCGFVEGALLSMDRLLRDHPMSVGFYPTAADGHLLLDAPERYCLASPR
jgi:putative component of membrane protein insertase Oxa1/YidC/SpoIIIJ protein YidD